jgi:hypothetical protein
MLPGLSAGAAPWNTGIFKRGPRRGQRLRPCSARSAERAATERADKGNAGMSLAAISFTVSIPTGRGGRDRGPGARSADSNRRCGRNLDAQTLPLTDCLVGERPFHVFYENGIAKLVRAIVAQIEFPIYPRESFVIHERTQQLVMTGTGLMRA